jgi:hypothetical protein
MSTMMRHFRYVLAAAALGFVLADVRSAYACPS